MKTVFTLLIVLFSSNLFSQTEYTNPEFVDNFKKEQAKALYPLSENLMGSTAWPLIISELEFTLKIGYCGDFPGIKARMIEPIGYAERVQKPLNFPFIGMSFGGNIQKTASIRESGSDDGGNTMREQTAHSHFIYVPILGLILKKYSDFWCLHKGPMAIPYMSEFDPTYKQDFLYGKMVPDILIMISPDIMLSTIFDCVASEGSNILRGFSVDLQNVDTDTYMRDNDAFLDTGLSNSERREEDKISKMSDNTLEGFDTIRNSLYFIDGCNGYSGIGGYQDGEDPIKDAAADWHQLSITLRGASALTQTSFLDKQTNITFLPANNDKNPPTLVNSMCGPRSFRLAIPSEDPLQLAYPVVGKPYEIGATTVSYGSAKMIPAIEGVVNVVWQRRDFYAFAYNCPGSGSRNKQ